MITVKSISQKFTAVALGFMTLAAAFTMMSAPAAAQSSLKLGQCGTPGAVMQSVAKEGHGFVANMNADLFNRDQNAAVKREHIVTATGNGSHWYMFRGDGAIGQSSKLCLAMKGTDLEINHNYDNDLASTTSGLAYNDNDALMGCVRLKQQRGKGLTCNGRNEMLDGVRQADEQKLLLQGTMIANNGQTNTLVTFVADPDNEEDYRILVTNKNNGATTIAQSGTDANLSPRVVGEIKK
ncbi:hypothetical protein GH722_04860 [Alphaproteobacteria bacterium HT1-32]|nr:hypothetical protein [Alphaproteobacteria bacterium HT1-32]